MKYDIFVSYRRTDRAMADALVERLRSRGASVWIDSHIEGGADWRETIVEALTNSDMLVILFTEECNDSRQLKKELAIADDLQKPVVPILLEDTRPRGAYLYELADRNWIQAWPEPESHFARIVDHLITLCKKTEDGLSGAVEPSASQPIIDAPAVTPIPPTSTPVSVTATAPTAPSSYVRSGGARLRETLPFRVRDLFFLGAALVVFGAVSVYATVGSFQSFDLYELTYEAPGILTAWAFFAALYCAIVFRLRSRDRTNLSDVLPFRLVDGVVLLPTLVGLVVFYFYDLSNVGMLRSEHSGMMLMFGPREVLFELSGVLLAYGALVFPVRYFLRRRPLRVAISKYLISSLILLVFAAASYFWANEYRLTAEGLASAALSAAVLWIGYAVVAFVIYGVLSGVRAMSSFRANLKTV